MRPELNGELAKRAVQIPKEGALAVQIFIERYSQDLSPQELALVTILGIRASEVEFTKSMSPEKLSEIKEILVNIFSTSSAANKS